MKQLLSEVKKLKPCYIHNFAYLSSCLKTYIHYVMVLVGVFSVMACQPNPKAIEYARVYDGLTEKDLNRAIRLLDKHGIPSQICPGDHKDTLCVKKGKETVALFKIFEAEPRFPVSICCEVIFSKDDMGYPDPYAERKESYQIIRNLERFLAILPDIMDIKIMLNIPEPLNVLNKTRTWKSEQPWKYYVRIICWTDICRKPSYSKTIKRFIRAKEENITVEVI